MGILERVNKTLRDREDRKTTEALDDRVSAINSFALGLDRLSAEEIAEKTAACEERLLASDSTETLSDILSDVFGVVSFTRDNTTSQLYAELKPDPRFLIWRENFREALYQEKLMDITGRYDEVMEAFLLLQPSVPSKEEEPELPVESEEEKAARITAEFKERIKNGETFEHLLVEALEKTKLTLPYTIETLTDEQVQAKTREFKERLAAGETVNDISEEALAVVRTAADRTLGKRHFDVQLNGGLVVTEPNNVAEMSTGEGKTLVVPLAAYLHFLADKPVHVVTQNDYLASEGAQEMGPLYHFLGMDVGVLQAGTETYVYDPESGNLELGKESLREVDDRAEAYQAGVTYGTLNSYGFDYLEDNRIMDDPTVHGHPEIKLANPSWGRTKKIQCRGHGRLILDELDDLLVDQASVPMILSGGPRHVNRDYGFFTAFANNARENREYTIEENRRGRNSVIISDEGYIKLEEQFGISFSGDINDESNSLIWITKKGFGDLMNVLGYTLMGDTNLPEQIELYPSLYMHMTRMAQNALNAKEIYHKDDDYIVQSKEVLSLDPVTDRPLPGQRLSYGMHQAIESKEGLPTQPETFVAASMTVESYVSLYDGVSGMTGTAKTIEDPLQELYGFKVIVIPTNKPVARIDEPTVYHEMKDLKYKGLIEDIKEAHERGQPILFGAVGIEEANELSQLLDAENLPHNALTAENSRKEAQIIAQAGRPFAITIATGIAGRGTDIILGGNPERLDISPAQWLRDHLKVIKEGGLFVLGSELFPTVRATNQFRGRSGRQGDPGKSRFHVCPTDAVLQGTKKSGGFAKRLFNIMRGKKDEDPVAIFEEAQEASERAIIDRLKHRIQYNKIVSLQRETMYADRDKAVFEADADRYFMNFVETLITRKVYEHLNVNEYIIEPEPVEQPKEKTREEKIDEMLAWLQVMSDYDAVLPEALALTDYPLAPQAECDEIEETEEIDVGPWTLTNLTLDDRIEGLLYELDEIFGFNFDYPEHWDGVSREDLVEDLMEQAKEKYLDFERIKDPNPVRHVIQHILLQMMDAAWVDHLTQLEELRQNASQRGLGNNDPLQTFISQGLDDFHDMQQRVQDTIIRIIYKDYVGRHSSWVSAVSSEDRAPIPDMTQVSKFFRNVTNENAQAETTVATR